MAGGWQSGFLAMANATDMGASTSGSQGTILPGGTSANTKGAWTQVIAATPHDCTHLLATFNNFTAQSSGSAFDIGIGAAGSEIALISNIVLTTGYIGGGGSLMLPAQLPAGTRIAARYAGIVANDPGLVIAMHGLDVGYDGGVASLYDTYGWSGSGAPQGHAIDPGATVNTKSAFVQLTASLTADIAGFFLGFDTQNDLPSATLNDLATFLVDLAIGAAGSEQVVLPNLVLAKVYQDDAGADPQANLAPLFTPFIPMAIPAGTRVAARAQCALTTTPQRLFGISLYGLRR